MTDDELGILLESMTSAIEKTNENVDKIIGVLESDIYILRRQQIQINLLRLQVSKLKGERI